MKKSLAAYGICLLIVGVGFCGFCVMSVAKDHLLVSRDLLYEKSAFTEGFAEVYEAPAAIKDKLADIPTGQDHQGSKAYRYWRWQCQTEAYFL